MRKLHFKSLAIITAAVLLCCGAVAAVATDSDTTADTTTDTQTADNTAVTATATDGKTAKEETVYVISDANGAPSQIIVSNWIKNGDKADKVKDVSDLTDIQNLKDDFTFTEANGVKTWDAKGKDVYYRGNSKKDLPVTMSVKYTLDGKEVKASELAGKSGKITMEFAFANNNQVTVNGKNVYVPYAAISGAILDNAKFTNVEVTGGKLINDGDKSIVAGIAFPGLNSNLGLTDSEMKLPESIVVTADVKDFSLAGTMSIVTNEIFNSFDTSSFSSVDTIKGEIDGIKSKTTEMVGGVNQLYDGLQLLSKNTKEFIAGVSSLYAGSKDLATGAGSLYDGSTTLKNGITDLSTGITTLNSKNTELQTGAKQVFNTLLASTQTQIQATFTANNVPFPVPTLTIENYKEKLTNLNTQIGGDATLTQAIASLDAYNKFYTGLNQYTGGVSLAASNMPALVKGATDLNAGAKTLYDGTNTLKNGAYKLYGNCPALQKGVDDLASGAGQIKTGLDAFVNEALSKLTTLEDSQIESVANGITDSIAASRNYSTFSGKSNDMNGTVKFIYRTDAVEK